MLPDPETIDFVRGNATKIVSTQDMGDAILAALDKLAA